MKRSHDLLQTKRFLTLASLLFISALFSGLVHNPPQFIQGDIWVWINDSSHAISCLNDSTQCSKISKYPIAYLANSFILSNASSLLGLSSQQSILLLNIIFALLYFLLLGLLISKENNNSVRPTIPIVLLSFVVTPLIPFYLYSGFLEIQAGLLLSASLLLIPVFFARDSSQNSSVKNVYSLLILFFALYKDTYAPMLIIAVLVTILIFRASAGHDHRNYLSGQRTFAFYTITPCCISLLLASFYNYIRYKSLLPASYLNESLSVQTSTYFKIESLMAIILAPQGGIIFFWGLAIILCLYYRTTLLTPSYSISLAFVFFVLCFAVSVLWWAPFGWDSWGNRLIIPSMIPFLTLLVIPKHSYEPHLNLHLTPSGNAVSLSLTFLVAVCSLYYLCCSYSPWGRIQLMRDHLYKSRECHLFITELRSQESPQYPTKEYEACASNRYWSWPELRVPSAFPLVKTTIPNNV